MAKLKASNYEKRAAERSAALEKLEQIEPSFSARAGKIATALEGGFFTLAIMGQVKRGKTTIANALLGEALLPVDALPLTSVVTTIRYGKRRKFIILSEDGKQMEIAPSQIADYITEERNPENEKKVQRLEAEYPSDFLARGVVLVDTPGIGSVHLHNTEITHQFLPEVDAALFVLSPDPPITEPECAFLVESAKHASKFFFVLTKSDYLSAPELTRIAQFNRKVIAEKIGLNEKDVVLHSISAKRALEAKQRNSNKVLEASGLPDFEAALERFVVRYKGELVLGSSAGKAGNLAQELLNQRLVEKSGMSTSAEELEFRLQRFDAEREKAHVLKVELETMLGLEQQRMMEALDEDLQEFVRLSCEKITPRAMEYAKRFRDCGNAEFNTAVGEFRSALVLKALGNFRELQEQKLSREFSRRVQKYSTNVDGIIERMEKAASGIFKVQIKSAPSAERLTLESNFYFKLSEEGQDVAGPGLELALPRSIFRNRKMGRIAEQVGDDLDRNAGRMRYDFLERMQRSADKFKWQLSDKIDAVAEGIRMAGERARRNRKAGQKQASGRLARIERDILLLKRIASVCEKMKHYCTKCSTQDGVTSLLEKDASGVYVCRINPKHRFKEDDSGFIHSVE